MLRKKFYKDMDKFRRTRNAQKHRYYGKTQNAANRCMSWTENELDAIMRKEKTDMEISAEIGRSVKAIQVMRCKMKKKGEVLR